MNQDMNIRKVAVSEINPAKYNPRKDLKPGDPVYEKLKRSTIKTATVPVSAPR